MIPLFPRNPDPSRFGNKYKSLLTCLATGIKTYANQLQGFEELLAPEAFSTESGYSVGTWRILPLHLEEKYLNDEFLDAYPERFDTNSPEFHQIYSKHHILDLKYHKIPKPIRRRILDAQEWIPWKPSLKQHLDTIPLLHRVLGVSVRTWRAPHDSCALAAHRAKSFNPQKYLDIIKQFENKVEAIFFSFDNPDAEKYFQDVKIPRLNPTIPSNSPLLQAAIKSQILGNCGTIVGDKDSTFLEVAWWMGKCQADVILIS